MAERNALISHDTENQSRAVWSGLLFTGGPDTGNWVSFPQLNDKCIQVSGTPGGASITFEGTNEADPVEAESIVATLRDAFSNAALSALVPDDIRQVGEHPKWVRPVVVLGDGTTNLKVVMHSVGKRR